jgi:hypothetical protein
MSERDFEIAMGSNSDDLQHAMMAILKASAELSTAQAALDATPDLTTAPRDHAARKVVEAFNRFAAGAQAAKKPLTIKITLSPQSGAR